MKVNLYIICWWNRH